MPKITGLVDYRPDAGITKLFHRLHDGDWAYEIKQDCAPIADANAEARNHCNPYNKSRDLRLDARIPLIYRQVWLDRYGVDFLSPDRDVQKKVDKLLDDPEWRWMKTTDERLS